MTYDYDPQRGFQPRQNNQPSGGGQGNNNNEWVSWLIIGLAFAFFWPLGIFLLISKLSDGSRRRQPRQTVHYTVNTGDKRYQQTAQQNVYQANPAAQQPKQSAAQKLTKTPQYGAGGAKAMKIVGAVLGVIGVLALGDSVFDWSGVLDLFYSIGMLAGGVGLFYGGIGMQKRARRFAKYLAFAGNKEAIPIADLARAADIRPAKAEKDLEIMVEKGLWGEGAYVDAGLDMLFLSPEAAEEYRRKEAGPAVPEETEEGYSGILRNIRRANDRIADPVLSEKIARLEDVAGKIFKLIEAEPAKRDKASTFLNYYLPTTQKLLDSYADFEEAGVDGENLKEAKARIADTMDNIVAGFEHQLDELYRTEAMDIDSDIRVMETMLRRDTASVEKDFGLGGGTAVQEADTDIE